MDYSVNQLPSIQQEFNYKKTKLFFSLVSSFGDGTIQIIGNMIFMVWKYESKEVLFMLI